MVNEKKLILISPEDWLGYDNKLGCEIWRKKYQHDGESVTEWIERVSGGNCDIAQLIRERKFLFGGRILANRGLNNGTYNNCMVLSVEDSLESIYDTAKNMAVTFKAGGGVGLDISPLAPNGAKVNNPAKTSSGAVSFIDVFTTTAGIIGQNGRRSATMISISCNHPDVEEFIKLKTDVDKATTANLSIRVSDDFMKAVKDDEDWTCSFTRKETGEVIEKTVKAKDLFKLFCDANYDYGEPGLLFWDTINNYNLLSEYPDFHYAGVNPCVSGDTRILTRDGEFEIKDLVDKWVEVWNGYEYSWVVPRITGLDQEDMLFIEFSNGAWLSVTPYHKFILENGGRVEARRLQEGDKLISWETPNHQYVQPVRVVGVSMGRPADKVYCMNEPKNHSFIANGVITGNCGELPLPDGGACLLGSMNLAEYVKDGVFDMRAFVQDVPICVEALDQVLSEGIPLLPLEIQKETATKWRPIGLGIMGLADMLIRLGLRYDTEEARDVCRVIADAFVTSAIQESIRLGEVKGSFPAFDAELIGKSTFFKANRPEQYHNMNPPAMRNGQLLTIPPTGTIATMLGVSTGIEPLFALDFTRTTKSLNGRDESYVITPDVVREARFHKDLYPLVTAQDIDYKDRLMMQDVWQECIDNSISSTVNLREDFPREDVAKLYMMAWQYHLKGVTVFRDNCKRDSILKTVENEEPKAPVDVKAESLIGKKRKLMTGCGSLHVTAFFDKDTGQLRETYLSRGSTGGCANFMTGLSRMISLSARSGCDLDNIVDQLKSCGVCPSYAVRRATKGDTSVGSCCPMAVGNALVEMHEEMLSEMNNTPAVKGEIDVKPVKNPCPQCGAELTFSGGCNVCPMCGWSRCS